MDIRPVKTEEDYETALEEIERLMEAEPDTPEGDRLEVLTALVEAYETEHYPIDPPDPIEAIKYYVESRGLDRRDLEPYIGHRGRVSEILNKKRPLTLRMIRNLEKGLGIPAAILVRPYDLADEEGEQEPASSFRLIEEIKRFFDVLERIQFDCETVRVIAGEPSHRSATTRPQITTRLVSSSDAPIRVDNWPKPTKCEYVDDRATNTRLVEEEVVQ